MGPFCPAAKQTLALGQKIALRLFEFGRGFCWFHAPPAVRVAGVSGALAL